MASKDEAVPRIITRRKRLLPSSSNQVWAHAVSSQAELRAALANKDITAIETDLLMGTTTTTTSHCTTTTTTTTTTISRPNITVEQENRVPIMAHPPDRQSDLSMIKFLDMVTASASSTLQQARISKVIKLDFKELETLEPTLQEILKRNISTTITTDNNDVAFVLNADILPGPGRRHLGDVIIPTEKFLKTCLNYIQQQSNNTRFALSLGFKTDCMDAAGYTLQDVNAMSDVMTNYQLLDGINGIIIGVVLALNARQLAKSLSLVDSIMKDFPSLEILAWTGKGEPPIPRSMIQTIKDHFDTLGMTDRIGFDCQITKSIFTGVAIELGVSAFAMGKQAVRGVLGHVEQFTKAIGTRKEGKESLSEEPTLAGIEAGSEQYPSHPRNEITCQTSNANADNNADASSDANTDGVMGEESGKDKHVYVLLSLEFHGTEYGGWQRQGPNNHIILPSVQGTLEHAATVACQSFDPTRTVLISTTSDDDSSSTDKEGSYKAVLAGSSGRTDKAVHARGHRCVLRLPFAKSLLQSPNTSGLIEWLVGTQNPPTGSPRMDSQSSPFLTILNQALPSDIHVHTCRSLTRQQRRELKFCRKRYRYLMQIPPPECPRPMKQWDDYTCFVYEPLDLEKMQLALQDFVGRHDFLRLSAQKGSPNFVRTIYSAKMTIFQYPFDSIPWFTKAYRQPIKRIIDVVNNDHRRPSGALPCFVSETGADYDPVQNNGIPLQYLEHYRLVSIEFEGNGFLRHQVRRMISVLQKVGTGLYPPDCIGKILAGDQDTLKATIEHPKLRRQAESPGRGLWLDRVWISGEEDDIIAS